MSVELWVGVDQRMAMKAGKPSGEWQRIVLKDEDVKEWTEEQRNLVGQLIHDTPSNGRGPKSTPSQCLGNPHYGEHTDSFYVSGMLVVDEVSPAGVLRAAEVQWAAANARRHAHLAEKAEKIKNKEQQARKLLSQPMSSLIEKDNYQKVKPWKPISLLRPPVCYDFLAELSAQAWATCDSMNAQHAREIEQQEQKRVALEEQKAAQRNSERVALEAWAKEHGSETTKLRLKLGYDSWEESVKKDKENIQDQQADKIVLELAKNLGMAMVCSEEPEWDNEYQRTHPVRRELEAELRAKEFPGVLNVQVNMMNWDEKYDNEDGDLVQERKSEAMLFVEVQTEYGSVGRYLRWQD